MLGWARLAAAWASRRKRFTNGPSPAYCSRSILTATMRPEDVVAGLVDGRHAAAAYGGNEGIAAVEDASDTGPTTAAGAVYSIATFATFVCTRQ